MASHHDVVVVAVPPHDNLQYVNFIAHKPRLQDHHDADDDEDCDALRAGIKFPDNKHTARTTFVLRWLTTYEEHSSSRLN